NVVTIDGLGWTSATSTPLLGSTLDDDLVFARLSSTGYATAGIVSTRSVVFSRDLGFALVDDALTSPTPRTYRQLWHLVEDASPTITGADVVTHRTHGNLLIRDLTGAASLDVVTGTTSPVQG